MTGFSPVTGHMFRPSEAVSHNSSACSACFFFQKRFWGGGMEPTARQQLPEMAGILFSKKITNIPLRSTLVGRYCSVMEGGVFSASHEPLRKALSRESKHLQRICWHEITGSWVPSGTDVS